MTNQEYARLIDRLNEVSAKIETPTNRRDFLALCEEYDDLMTKLEQTTPEYKS